MANEHLLNRRNALVMAGAAGLGLLGVATPSATAQKKAEKFERLEKAIAEMNEAKAFLEKGMGFGGHKKKAIDALNVAIDELNAAIKFAMEKKK